MHTAEVFVSVYIIIQNSYVSYQWHITQQTSVHVSLWVPQPLFKNLADLWCGLQEEAELLKILHNILLNLKPFTTSQAELFPTAYLDSLLEGSEVKTHDDRMKQISGIG